MPVNKNGLVSLGFMNINHWCVYDEKQTPNFAVRSMRSNCLTLGFGALFDIGNLILGFTEPLL